MTSEAKSWPLVDVRDDGIRPAGPSDACFYCKRRVGEEHGRDCAVVNQRVLLRVRVGPHAGTFEDEAPFCWDRAMVESYWNDSSMCASNVLGMRVQWEGDADEAWAACRRLDQEKGCLCHDAIFELVRVTDPGPLRALREDD
jgi:hypothetical protein